MRDSRHQHGEVGMIANHGSTNIRWITEYDDPLIYSFSTFPLETGKFSSRALLWKGLRLLAEVFWKWRCSHRTALHLNGRPPTLSSSVNMRPNHDILRPSENIPRTERHSACSTFYGLIKPHAALLRSTSVASPIVASGAQNMSRSRTERIVRLLPRPSFGQHSGSQY
jgi:hypothetical protein